MGCAVKFIETMITRTLVNICMKLYFRVGEAVDPTLQENYQNGNSHNPSNGHQNGAYVNQNGAYLMDENENSTQQSGKSSTLLLIDKQ